MNRNIRCLDYAVENGSRKYGQLRILFEKERSTQPVVGSFAGYLSNHTTSDVNVGRFRQGNRFAGSGTFSSYHLTSDGLDAKVECDGKTSNWIYIDLTTKNGLNARRILEQYGERYLKSTPTTAE